MRISYEQNLAGKVAVVTGGSGVLCSCMARSLAECGVAVAVAGLHPERAEAVAKDIRAVGGKAIGVGCDVLSRDSMAAACAAVEQEFGPVDILINGAGGNHPKGTTSMERLRLEDLSATPGSAKTFFDLDPEGLEFVFGLNFHGTLISCQAFTRGMAERGRGTVINISSMSGVKPLTKIPAYSAAKAAVGNFTQWLAVHLSGVGIRVNAIAPGFFLTNQNRALLTQPDGSLTARGQAIIGHTPMGRFGVPDELVGAMLWLADDKASGFVTGAVIPIDGGFSAFSGV